ncbi:flagellar hook-length control protein FliK [Haliea salexigens]|uniref:flagellar hook-length control protein FliK n=1 Tax=Haliea salexigens TaxID=287487 RepID=UPI0003F59035|nr:flagellar hook-length control protein FliK [Haliea salexigens]
MITVLQTLPVASSDANVAPGNTAQDGAENGFSQLFAAARAGASDRPAGGGNTSRDGKGGNAASSGGSGLPPASGNTPGVAGGEAGSGVWQPFTLALEGLAEPAPDAAAAAADAALPSPLTVSTEAAAAESVVGASPVTPLTLAETTAGAVANSLALPDTGVLTTGVAATGSARLTGETAAGALPVTSGEFAEGPAKAGQATLQAGAPSAGQAAAQAATARAEALTAAEPTAASTEEAGMLAAAERLRGEEATALQAARQRAPEGGLEPLRAALAAGGGESAPPTTALSATQGANATADTSAPTAPRTPAHLAMTHAPQDAEFAGELANRLQVFARNGGHEATLQLHPADLGRLQVSITTEGDQARVVFVADSAAARDAIEQSMPRLREMLAQSGLQLSHSDVSGQFQGGADSQRDAPGLPRTAGTDGLADGAVPGTAEPGAALASTGVRLVDYYI